MNHKISTNEILTICFCMITSLFPGLGNILILKTSGTTSILTSIIGLAIGFIPIIMILYIYKSFKDDNIFKFNKEKLSILGLLLNLLLIIGAVFICFINSWSVFDFIISQFLTRNSYYIIALTLCTIIAIGVIRGIEVIGRSTLILFIGFIFISILVFALLIPKIEINNLLPMFTISNKNFITSTLTFASLSSIPYIFILGIKKNIIVDKEKYNRKIIISYLLAGLYTISILFLTLSTFGINLASIFTYPEYTLFKSIRAFEFIERIENIVAITIFISYFGNFAFLIYFIKEGINNFKSIKNERNQKILIYLLSIIIPFTSIYLFKNYQLINLYKQIPTILGSFIIIIAIIFMRCLFIKKKTQEKS